ncbi:MAG: KilA-N domain-containing protein [Clostridia bacterium]|nr:KilA-N domain-containing protein [Clostridia bacterium]
MALSESCEVDMNAYCQPKKGRTSYWSFLESPLGEVIQKNVLSPIGHSYTLAGTKPGVLQVEQQKSNHMKTNQVMLRKMGDFTVTQRTKDGFFNATALLKQWNSATCSQKELKHYFENKSTEEFINALILEENFCGRNSAYVKSKASRGENAGTWMHPLMFIDFAMWINPTFKVKVLKFVYDEMIKYRNEAGDAYKELGGAVGKIVSKEFMPRAMSKIGEALNWVVFNGHEKLLRNKNGEEKSLRELWQLERKVADLINEGFITSYDNLIAYLRNQYQKRNIPACIR